MCTGEVELRKSVKSLFGIDLPATATSDYPTLSALAVFIASGVAPSMQVSDPGFRLQSAAHVIPCC